VKGQDLALERAVARELMDAPVYRVTLFHGEWTVGEFDSKHEAMLKQWEEFNKQRRAFPHMDVEAEISAIYSDGRREVGRILIYTKDGEWGTMRPNGVWVQGA